MKKNKQNFYKRDFDYEEDDYDRLKHRQHKDDFTNKARLKKLEFDYEEDAYEPRTRR